MATQEYNSISVLSCRCEKLSAYEYLGMDANYAEVSMAQCLTCNQHWLHYFYQEEGFSNSGRWYRGVVALEQIENFNIEDAKSILESLQWYYYGGSYFYGKTGKSAGKILI